MIILILGSWEIKMLLKYFYVGFVNFYVYFKVFRVCEEVMGEFLENNFGKVNKLYVIKLGVSIFFKFYFCLFDIYVFNMFGFLLFCEIFENRKCVLFIFIDLVFCIIFKI